MAHALKPLESKLPRRTAKRDYAPSGWKKEKSFPAFLAALASKGNPRDKQKRIVDTFETGYVEKAAMSELSGTTGGYLVPMDYNERLLQTIDEHSFIRPRATVVPMTSGQMQLPQVDYGTTQVAGSSPFFGGITFKCQGDGASITETEPAFRSLELHAWDLVGYAVVSNQMLWDITPAGEQFLFNLFGRAAAWFQDYLFLNGKGANSQMPLGVLNAPGAVTVTRHTGSKIDLTNDVSTMCSKLIPFSWHNAVWACSPGALAQIVQLTGWMPNAWNDGDDNATPGALMTRPLFVTEKLPALGTQGDLILFDPFLYVIGDRLEIAIDASPHFLLTTNQTAFRIWCRIDGVPWLSSSVTLQDATTTAAAYVILK